MTSEPRQAAAFSQAEGRQAEKLQTLGVLLVIAALVTAFWWPTLFDGKTLVHGDSIVHGLPLMDLHSRALHGDASVLWSNQIYGGHPIFAEGQGAFAHPLNILLAALVPPIYGHNLFHFLCMLLMAAGTFGLCRTLGISRFASGFAALAAAFATVTVGSQQNLAIGGSITWIPWALWAMEAWLRRPDAIRGVLLGASCCLMILAGYPQVFHGTVLYMVVSLLTQPLAHAGREHLSESWRRLLASGVLAILLCAGLAAVQLLPLLELTGLSHRSEGVGLLSFMPDDATAYWRGFMYTLDGLTPPPEGYFPGSGSIVVCAAAALVLILKTPLRAKGHLLATLLLIQLGIGNSSPLFNFLYEHHLIPGLIFFRTMSTYLNIAVVGFAVVAAFGVDALVNYWQRQPRPVWLNPVAAGATVLFCGGLAWLAWRLYSPVMPMWNIVVAVIAVVAVLMLTTIRRATWIPFALFAALGIECVLLHLHEIHFGDVAQLKVAASSNALKQAGADDYRFMDRTTRAGYAFINSREPAQRLYVQYVIASYTAMTNLLSGMSSIHGALALPLKRRVLLDPLLLEETDGRSSALPGQRAIDVLALRYVASNAESTLPTFRVALHELPAQTVPNAANDATIDTWLMENIAVKPRIQAYTRYVVASSMEAAADVLRTAREDALIIEAGGELAVTNDTINAPQAITTTVRKASATEYVIDVDADRVGWVFLADANYPGWKATVDGNDSQVFSANLLGKAVAVPVGKHRVEMRFESTTFRGGLICTLVSLLVAVVVLAVAWRKQILIQSNRSKGIT